MGGSKTTVKQRELSDEEKQLYAQQVKYMQTIQPAIEQMVSQAMNNVENTYDPDWESTMNTYDANIQDILDRQNTLLNGELPEQWTNARQTYYNNLYENTMGSGLQSLAKNGVINSSRMNTAANDWQKTLSNQMSQDYTSDVSTYNNLLDKRASWLSQGLQDKANAASSSRSGVTDYLTAAGNAQSGVTNGLSAISNNENNRTYLSQSSSGLGSFLGGVTSGLSSYYGAKK